MTGEWFQFSNNQILTGLAGTLFGKIVQKHETPVRAEPCVNLRHLLLKAGSVGGLFSISYLVLLSWPDTEDGDG